VSGTLAVDWWAVTFGTARRSLGGQRPCQGAYNTGRNGNLREFVNYGKLGEFKISSGNLSDAVDCYMIVTLGHLVMCIIVSNSSINWLSDTATGVDRASHHAPSIKYSVILQESCRTDC